MAACQRMVAELIDHIEVYHAEKQDGVTNQRVVIYYNCIGAFDVPDRRKIPEADIIMETRKGVALSYAPGTPCSMNFVGNKKAECNDRISENTDISTVCWQSARGIHPKLNGQAQ